MKIINLDQSTGEWLKWRMGGIGASEAASVVNENPWCSSTQLLNKKLGTKSGEARSGFFNTRMQRGKDLEPVIRDLYMAFTGIRIKPICCQSDEHPFMLASLDGISECEKIVVEIKAPNSETHKKALASVVPPHYYWQVLHQLIVTGAEKAHYVSYTDSSQYRPEDQLAVVTVNRDPVKEEYLIRKEELWWEWFQTQKSILNDTKGDENEK